MFHGIDGINGYITDQLTKPLQNDKERIVRIANEKGCTVEELVRYSYPNAFEGDRKIKEEYRGISDIMSGMFGIKFGKGHSKEYWRTGKKLEKEALAQYGRIQYDKRE